MLSFDTSPDGSTWTSQRSVATPSWANAVVVRFAIGAVKGTSSGSSTFADVQ